MFISQNNNLIYILFFSQMPNLLQSKKSLFSVKYPSVPKKFKTAQSQKAQKKIPLKDVEQSQELGKRTRRLPKRFLFLDC